MPVDNTWLLLTEIYAVAALAALLAVLLVSAWFVRKVVRTAKQTKARIQELLGQPQGAVKTAKSTADNIGARAQRTAALVKTAAQRIAGALKAIHF